MKKSILLLSAMAVCTAMAFDKPKNCGEAAYIFAKKTLKYQNGTAAEQKEIEKNPNPYAEYDELKKMCPGLSLDPSHLKIPRANDFINCINPLIIATSLSDDATLQKIMNKCGHLLGEQYKPPF